MIDVLPYQQQQQQQQQPTPDQQDLKAPPAHFSNIQIKPDNLYYVQGVGAENSTFAIDRATCDIGDIALSGGNTRCRI